MMTKSKQPRDMRYYNGWGLFAMQPVPGGFAVLVHDIPIVGPVSYAAAHELFKHLIAETVKLDGDAKALAVVWGHAANAIENLRTTQARCTELLDQYRDQKYENTALKEKIRIAHELLYRVKFTLEQNVYDDLDMNDPNAKVKLTEAIIAVLDKTSSAPIAICQKPPPGWRCTRGVHEDGPCAAVPDEDASQ